MDLYDAAQMEELLREGARAKNSQLDLFRLMGMYYGAKVKVTSCDCTE